LIVIKKDREEKIAKNRSRSIEIDEFKFFAARSLKARSLKKRGKIGQFLPIWIDFLTIVEV